MDFSREAPMPGTQREAAKRFGKRWVGLSAKSAGSALSPGLARSVRLIAATTWNTDAYAQNNKVIRLGGGRCEVLTKVKNQK